ncbi:MAG: DNRLRE domain-containing protein [Phycisphaerales bacterium]|nr:DNRLRE domain-containing protein [Phycisphaerales bacterium]
MRWTAAALATLAFASAAWADLISVGALRDNTLYESSTGSLSNGQGVYVFSGRTSQGLVRRALLQFDLSLIPAGSTITSATLSLRSDQAQGSATYTLHRLLATWGEGSSDAGSPGGAGTAATSGDATWLHRFHSTTTWTNAGGDFVASASASTVVAGAGPYSWSGAGLVQDVQAWLDGGAISAGWALLGNEVNAGSAVRFGSSENATSNMRPELTIEYTPAPAPGAAGLGVLALLGGLRRRR